MEFSKEKEEQEKKMMFHEQELLKVQSEADKKAEAFSELSDKFTELSLFYTNLEAELLEEKTKNSKLNERLMEAHSKNIEEKTKYELDL